MTINGSFVADVWEPEVQKIKKNMVRWRGSPRRCLRVWNMQAPTNLKFNMNSDLAHDPTIAYDKILKTYMQSL